MPIQATLSDRANGACELCGDTTDCAATPVPPDADANPDRNVWTCATCRAELENIDAESKHWNCLREAVWSQVPAVQVLSWRVLNAIDAPWARELLDQVWLDDDTRAWAEAGDGADDGRVPAKDSNGATLLDGDSVTLIKDLDVKGTSFVAKRGTMVRGIRLTTDPGLVEGRVNKVLIVLKTEFLKKAR